MDIDEKMDSIIPPTPHHKMARGVVIVVQGVPAIGKTTLASEMVKILTSIHKIRSCHIEQDTFVEEHGRRGAGRACRQYFDGCLNSGQNLVVILARNNSCEEQYRAYAEMAKKHSYLCIGVYPKEVYTCISCANCINREFCFNSHSGVWCHSLNRTTHGVNYSVHVSNRQCRDGESPKNPYL